MGPWETTMRRRIAEAEAEGQQPGGLAQVRRRDAETLRRILREWENALTPEGRKAAELGIPTGPHDGGFV